MKKKLIFAILYCLCSVVFVVSCMSIPTTYCKPTETNTTTVPETSESINAKPETEPSVSQNDSHVHQYEAEVINATCTENGYTLYVCVDCNDSYVSDETEKLEHEYQALITEATCELGGYTTYTCTKCNHSYVTDEINALNHVYQSLITEATCELDGYTTYTCTRCGYLYIGDEVNALGHEYETKTVEPTLNEQGYDLHTCKRCQHIYKDNYKVLYSFKEVDETVYATGNVNVRTGPSTDYKKIGSLQVGESVRRIGIGDNGWSKVIYNGEEAYIHSDYLSRTKPTVLEYPLTYSDSTCTITIYREWYKNAYVYAAHIVFTDYSRLSTDCANGKYDNGYETTSHAAKRLNAIFAVNGCYSAPYLNYTVVRGGKIWNGADRNLCLPAVYSAHNGLLLSAWEGNAGDPRVKGQVQQLVDDGLVTDTFCFGPPGLINGELIGKNEGARAQRTFIGTNGNAGDIWICVSDGRYNDGSSAGLRYYEAMEYLKEKGCTFGLHLDGGGSSTMYFNGTVLNAARGNQRAVVDFVYFK